MKFRESKEESVTIQKENAMIPLKTVGVNYVTSLQEQLKDFSRYDALRILRTGELIQSEAGFYILPDTHDYHQIYNDLKLIEQNLSAFFSRSNND